ncbi:MAG TPA: hypothetical protein PKD86_00020 [Gemmatales bacterium]|nr:hypothetical protein [Gemmatales bacterium]
MPDEKTESRDFSVRQWLPWTEIFRAFQIALDPAKMLLASAAVFLLWMGWALLGMVMGPKDSSYGVWPGNVERGANPVFAAREVNPGEFARANFLFGDAKSVPVQFEPFQRFIGPVLGLLRSTPRESSWYYYLIGLLYTAAVWAVFGGAITRMVAVQFARRERIGMMEAVRYSLDRFVPFFLGPLLPLAGVAVIGVLMTVVAFFLFALPFVEIVASLLWFLPILGGIAMTFLLVGYIGWPIMYATISVEGTDAFDAISRCYAYVYQRPWQYIFYLVLAFFYGLVTVFVVVLLGSLAVYLAKWGVGLMPLYNYWRDSDPLSTLFVYAPTSYGWRELLIGNNDLETLVKDMSWYQVLAAGIMAFWMHAVFLLLIGFAYSFFWSSQTVVYFLMRKKVDDTDMDEVFLEESEESMTFPPAPGAEPASPLPAAAEAPGANGASDAPKDESTPSSN